MSPSSTPLKPLAERIRPTTLDEYRGQKTLIGENGPIKRMIETDTLTSFILWGSPGTGKTTIARIISEQTNSEFFQLNAVSSGVKDVRQVIEKARENLLYSKRTILFIDEIHRFNKAQQDALLHSVESGEIILIGATTENPSFEVIPALRSRVRIFVMDELGKEDLNNILDFALSTDEFLKSLKITSIDRDFLFYISGGDARVMLNTLEAAVLQADPEKEIKIDTQLVKRTIQKKNVQYDKGGEEHFNIISAFIKSIRGSDPDAAVYWLARMLEGGEDPLFIARRLVILAAEDIGNASPNGLVLAEAAFSAVHKIGMPEARIILSQCATYLASSPKSNAAYTAIDAAFADIRNNQLYPVPLHLRNAPTKLMKDLDYGKEYKYPHSFPGNFVEANYFPDGMRPKQYYNPTENGQEKKLKDYLKYMWQKLKKY